MVLWGAGYGYGEIRYVQHRSHNSSMHFLRELSSYCGGSIENVPVIAEEDL